jgi:predicted Fe-S protein YdhL (DUF1289 family)
MSGAERPPREPTPVSPCIQICVMEESGHCRGCKRTLDEIARWSSMCDDEKRAVLAALQARGSGR